MEVSQIYITVKWFEKLSTSDSPQNCLETTLISFETQGSLLDLEF